MVWPPKIYYQYLGFPFRAVKSPIANARRYPPGQILIGRFVKMYVLSIDIQINGIVLFIGVGKVRSPKS